MSSCWMSAWFRSCTGPGQQQGAGRWVRWGQKQSKGTKTALLEVLTCYLPVQMREWSALPEGRDEAILIYSLALKPYTLLCRQFANYSLGLFLLPYSHLLTSFGVLTTWHCRHAAQNLEEVIRNEPTSLSATMFIGSSFVSENGSELNVQQ